MLKGVSKRTILIILACCCLYGTSRADISGRINAILGRKELSKVDVAIHIIKPDGQTVYTRNSEKPMIPASNMKLITSAAAVEYLGSGYEFKTTIGIAGDSLIVIGGGDPLLGDQTTDERLGHADGWIFSDITGLLKDRGVDEIEDIVIDSTFFDDNRVPANWPIDQLNQPYACEVSGLNYNSNCVRITVSNNSGRVKLSVNPQTEYLTLVNQVTITNKGNSAVGGYRNNVPNRLIVRGKCRKEAGFDVAIERPAAFFGFMAAERLKSSGINVKGKLVEKYVPQDKKLEVLKVYKTPISEVLRRCNKDSFGLAAECLVKTISAENTKGKRAGQWGHGLDMISWYLRKLGIKHEQFRLDDGSGLSRENRVTAQAITRVLLHVYNSGYWPMFSESFAVGGVDGTVSKYFKEAKYKGRIRGKTGYISGVRTFSGVCETSEGDYIFSILTQGGSSNVRKAINDITEAIVDSAD